MNPSTMASRVRLILATALAVAGLSALVRTDQPAFRAETTIVEVSAVVTKDGHVVTDIARSEVQLLDNGAPQDLVEFEFVDLTVPTGSGTQQRRDFVAVVDDIGIAPRLSSQVIGVLRSLVTMLGPQDRLAIVNTGPHELVMQLTTDRAEAIRLIQRVRGQKGSMPSFERQECHDTTLLLAVIKRVAQVMAGDPAERRAILVISEGRKIYMSDPGAGRIELCDEVRAEYDQLVGATAATNVAIYGIDPRGLEAPFPANYGANPRGGAAMAGQEAQFRVNLMASRYYGSLGLMASSTGGTLTTDRNDLTRGVSTMIADSRRYYRLAYRQPDVPEPKKLRSVQVTIARPGVEVRSRRSYLPR